MHRLAAISHDWLALTDLGRHDAAEPNTESMVHHHGPLETAVYVLSGQSKVRWGARLSTKPIWRSAIPLHTGLHAAPGD